MVDINESKVDALKHLEETTEISDNFTFYHPHKIAKLLDKVTKSRTPELTESIPGFILYCWKGLNREGGGEG